MYLPAGPDKRRHATRFPPSRLPFFPTATCYLATSPPLPQHHAPSHEKRIAPEPVDPRPSSEPLRANGLPACSMLPVRRGGRAPTNRTAAARPHGARGLGDLDPRPRDSNFDCTHCQERGLALWPPRALIVLDEADGGSGTWTRARGGLPHIGSSRSAGKEGCSCSGFDSNLPCSVVFNRNSARLLHLTLGLWLYWLITSARGRAPRQDSTSRSTTGQWKMKMPGSASRWDSYFLAVLTFENSAFLCSTGGARGLPCPGTWMGLPMGLFHCFSPQLHLEAEKQLLVRRPIAFVLRNSYLHCAP